MPTDAGSQTADGLARSFGQNRWSYTSKRS